MVSFPSRLSLSKKIKVPPMPKVIESYDDAGCMIDKVLVFKPHFRGPFWLAAIVMGMAIFVCGVMR